jgi:hypothetical protein
MHTDRPIRRRALAWLVCTIVLLGSAEAPAQVVYKCVDDEQHIAYQDTPCASSQRSESIRLAAAPPRDADASAMASVKTTTQPPRTTTRAARDAPVAQSFECRSASGAVFYRHGRCPASIPRRPGGSARGEASGSDRVEATRLPRSEACRRLRSTAREGSAHDETVSTYERNLGRDPCRRH